MQKMSEISTLWLSGELPIRDGLYRATGESFDVRVDPDSTRGYEVLGDFSLEEFRRDEPDEVTKIDIARKVPVSGGFVCCGEGSFGSEGFFAYLDDDEVLVWVIYLEESNPFVELESDGDWVKFRSTAGFEFSGRIGGGGLEGA